MDAETDYGGWADPAANIEAEDERAVRRFVRGAGSGLDIRTVRGFVTRCRRLVGPAPLLEPAMDMVLDGVRYEWGVWFRPRSGDGGDATALAGMTAYAPQLLPADAEAVSAMASPAGTLTVDAAEPSAASEPATAHEAAAAPATLPPASSMSAAPRAAATGIESPPAADSADGDAARTSPLPAGRQWQSM